MSHISLKQLLEAGCHFGHQPRRWNPKMRPYLYMDRSGVHIFDLVKTREGLEEAIKKVTEICKKDGKIIFVGTKRQAQGLIKQAAIRVGMPYITHRWVGGLLTNHQQVNKSTQKLKDLKQKRAIGKFEKYTKKEQLLIDREIDKLERFFGGLVDLEGMPDALFIVDTHREESAVLEAVRLGIPVIGIVDSNSDPDNIDIVIPANDDAVNSLQFIIAKIAEAAEKGEKKKNKQLTTDL